MSEAARYRLLMADDEPWVLESLRGLVDWDSMAIDLLPPAFDGEEALARLASDRPDILVTDINMPFVDGNALIRAAKERFPELQIVVLSGYSDFGFVRDALLDGAVDYLLKPIARSSLVEVLDKAIRLLGSGKAKEREEAELRERLHAASSILRDAEMSDAIFEESNGASRATHDLDLEFASFTLVLAKLAAGSGGYSALSGRKREEIKSVLAGAARGARQVVFHNLYARSEFILVSDLDSTALARALEELPDRITRRIGLRAGVAASGCHYSFDRLRAAYQEARAALMGRPLGSSRPGSLAAAGSTEVRRRVTPELENRLAFALESRNRPMALEVIFREIGLRGCEGAGWLIIEAKQTAEYVAGMIYHRADPGPSAAPRSMLAMDNLTDHLAMVLEEEDMSEACSALEQLLDEAFGESAPPGAGDSMTGVARRAREYVSEHYFEDISLTSVAAFFRVDRSYLCRAFKQVTGCNIMLAIAKMRIEKAKEYMRQRDLNLTDVADLVGYPEYAYFNRVFRKIAGMSPSEYKLSIGSRAP